MAAKVLNIEVGERIVKVCVSAKQGKGYRIEDSFMFQPPELSVSDGEIVNPDELAMILKSHLEAHAASAVKNVTFTLNSNRVISREITLPEMKDARIKSVVEANASEYFPVDMTGFRVSYAILERTKGDNPGIRVMVVAAPKLLLEGYVRLAQAVGLNIQAIDNYGNSQYQVLKGIQSEGVTMYVDVSVMNTLITFMKDGVQLLQRNVPGGGNEMINSAMMAAGSEAGSYVSTLTKCQKQDYVNEILGEDHTNLNRLVNGTARSLDFFRTQNPGENVNRIVLMGTCSRLAGLSQKIEEETRIETIQVNELPGIASLANSAEGISAFIACIGSMLAPVDLIPESAKRSRARAGKRDDMTFGIAILAIGLALAVGLSALSLINYFSAANEKKTIEEKIASLEYVEELYNTYSGYKKTSDEIAKLRSQAENNNTYLVAFLEEMEVKMPSDVLILSAVCDNLGVTMNISAKDIDSAANVIAQLRTFESVKTITVSTITESEDMTGTTVANFSVACGYLDEAETEPAEQAPVEADDDVSVD